jgi:hypothetical protein
VTGRRPRAAAGALAAAVAAATLAGCFIPQPLPGVGDVSGTPITPPRIVTESAHPEMALTPYGPPARCPGGAAFLVEASIIDENATEPVEVRWFVDYEPDNQARRTPLQVQTLPPPTVEPVYLREPDPFPFHPSDFDQPAEQVHVVEMCISNGFLPVGAPVPPGSLPNRTAAPGYAVQVFRWTFEPDPAGGCGP